MRQRPPGRGLVGLAVCVLAASSCAIFQDVSKDLPKATKPVKYKLVGANIELRKNLDRAMMQLKGESYQAAVHSLNRAIWELEQVETRWLRLEDLAEAHQALADAYSGLRRTNWADEHRKLSLALMDQVRRDPGSGWPERSLSRAKEAYVKAQFREALTVLGQALVNLEDLTHTAVRVRRLEEARCYLAFTYVALEDGERTKEELERLSALDPSLVFCTREAPPSVRRLITEVQQRRNRR
ncbi:MAG: hypothetical protein HYS14_05715 [Candidatus Rokubacteria bacterium]|nr:hypothetical protein [Candidatus Rokubacteria bacterium]